MEEKSAVVNCQVQTLHQHAIQINHATLTKNYNSKTHSPPNLNKIKKKTKGWKKPKENKNFFNLQNKKRKLKNTRQKPRKEKTKSYTRDYRQPERLINRENRGGASWSGNREFGGAVGERVWERAYSYIQSWAAWVQLTNSSGLNQRAISLLADSTESEPWMMFLEKKKYISNISKT